MKKLILIFILALLSFSLFGAYEVGETVDDFTWTDSNDEDHSIHELTANGKVVVFFWGGTT